MPVDVEVAVSSGIPAFQIVGMPDAAIQEARERIRAALRASGFSMPADRIVVNLAPSGLRKSGAGFDLPIALGVLVASGQLDPAMVKGKLFVGELSMDGTVRPVAGALAFALCARERGCAFVASPDADLVEIAGLEQLALRSLRHIRKEGFAPATFLRRDRQPGQEDYADIAGHEMAKRALQIAATGSHGLIMVGPPGSGKTMLASRFGSIMPPLDDEEAMEAALVHSVAGEDIAGILAGVRPFRKPHHSASSAGLIGGGTPPRPGEISLAHRGVLFLDELAEFKPTVLQGMRQPMESGEVVITRADGAWVFPARFQLIAASNPCPCGYLGDDEKACTCTVAQVRAYQNRIGGPLMDRIDLHLDVRRIPPSDILAQQRGQTSNDLREGVMLGREFASWRRAVQLDEGLPANPGNPAEMALACRLGKGERAFAESMAKANNMSGRGVMRMLSVARTVADLAESRAVTEEHICEALGYRVRIDHG